MRLIDGNALYEKTAEWEAQVLHMVEITMHDEDNAEWKRWSTILTERSAFKFDVADAPTIDAVPVVRCRECSVPHNRWTGCPKLGGLIPPDDFYCGFGRKNGDGDG